MRILVDMDGVLADYEQEFSRRWANQFPNRKYVTSEESPTFRQENRYPPEFQEDARNIPRFKYDV